MPTMMQSNRFQKHLIAITMLMLSACWKVALADDLHPTRQKLTTLRACLEGTDSQIDRLSNGLLSGYDQARSQGHDAWGLQTRTAPAPPPIEYLASLDRDISVCSAVAQITDSKEKEKALDSVRKDIQIKADDCTRFGMGRLVSVRIVTLRDATTDHGWEVYYKWNCLSGFPTDEVRMPKLGSPSVIDLPPGEYTIRAEKKVSATETKKTGTVTVIFGLKPVIDVRNCQYYDDHN